MPALFAAGDNDEVRHRGTVPDWLYRDLEKICNGIVIIDRLTIH